MDPEQITQALGNLLKNAIEAMPEGGLLKVKTCFTPNGNQPSISVGSRSARVGADRNDSNRHEPKGSEGVRRVPKASNGTVSLEIQDTGYGMSEETMTNLFVPYYTTKSEANGRGLGMPIVRRIVTEHGAEIDFQSTEGEGTTVRIHFHQNQETRSEEFV